MRQGWCAPTGPVGNRRNQARNERVSRREPLRRALAAEILAEAAELDAAEDADAVSGADDTAPEEVRSRGAKRRARLKELLAELAAEASSKSYEAHIARRAEIEAETGRPIRGRRPTPDSATHRSRRHANTTDPDSRLLKVKGYEHGFNAQAVATVDQWVVAAEVTNDAEAFVPMVATAKANLRRAGERTVVADAGYWSTKNVEARGSKRSSLQAAAAS